MKKIEREINLIDLFWEILSKWRVIIFSIVLFAIILGGLGSIKNYSRMAQSQKVLKTDDIELDQDAYEKVEVFLEYRELLYNQQEYNKKSPLMQLSTSGFYYGTANYYVDNYYQVEYPIISKKDNVGSIIENYKTSLISSEFCARLAEISGLEPSYCSEMLKLNDGNENSCFQVAVYADNEEECMKILEEVEKTISNAKSGVEENFGEHKVILTSSECIYTSDENIRTMQVNNVNDTNNMINNIATLKKALTEEELLYIEAYDREIKISKEEVKTQMDTSTSLMSIINIKYIVLGGGFGAAVIVIYIIFIYLISNRVRITDDFESCINIKLLGKVRVETESKEGRKIFGFADKKINKIRYNKKFIKETQIFNLTVANIKNMAQKFGLSQIYLTSSLNEFEQQEVVKALTLELKIFNIEIVAGDSILLNAVALEEAAKIGCVILIEKAGESRYQDIENAAGICACKEIELLGVVLSY